MFTLKWTREAHANYEAIKARAGAPAGSNRRKSSKAAGLLKQVDKCVSLLSQNPKHPSLQTHAYSSLEHPYIKGQKVFEAYVQHRTPGAYRLFWCYGPAKGQITIIAITPHP